MQIIEEKLLSTSHRDLLHVKIWAPSKKPIGVVQLIHGMIEHIERYHEFAVFLVDQGFVVIGHDHLGHGKSVAAGEPFGFFDKEKGVEYLIEDVHKVQVFAKSRYSKLPYFILGHSMGSLILRNYLITHPCEKFAGIILMGTAFEPVFKMESARQLAEKIIRIKAFKSGGKILNHLIFAGYNKRIAKPESAKDWLSSDVTRVEDYLRDELTQFQFSVYACRDLFVLTKNASDPQQLEKINPRIPILLISGEEDPVGGYGKNVWKLANLLTDGEMRNLEVVLVAQGRHEILNEKNRKWVYRILKEWLLKKLNH